MVVAPTMADAVRFTGGWLFDRVLAGSEALVLTADHADARPMRILGAEVRDLESALASPQPWYQARTIAVNAQLCRSDPRIGWMVEDVLDAGSGDVWFWGETSPLGHPCARQHRLSFAARAFKVQALAAAAVPGETIDETEYFDTASGMVGQSAAQPARAGGR